VVVACDERRPAPLQGSMPHAVIFLVVQSWLASEINPPLRSAKCGTTWTLQP
jgi:hypothetical protein